MSTMNDLRIDMTFTYRGKRHVVVGIEPCRLDRSLVHVTMEGSSQWCIPREMPVTLGADIVEVEL